MATLGRLERVDLRAIWETEAQHFTPWLAQEDNLAILGETVGIELELEAQEKNVGPFRADILCKDTATNDWVLIENQLERTDHIHLGQLLTYAAGLQAVTIVWISSQFTEEHRATLDWLNDITDERFRFFGLEVELWRIGDSLAAPKFNPVSKPNDWSRSVAQASRRLEDETLTETQANYLRYWSAFRDHLIGANSGNRPQKPSKDSWASYGIGRTGFWLSTSLNTKDRRIGVELYIGDESAKAYFHLLAREQSDIEAEMGLPLDWQELPERKGSRIAIYKENTDPADVNDWPNQHAWMADMLERFDRTFRRRVKALNSDDWNDERDEAAAE
ncbi:MAG: DUF4268 domain-containing protein [Acidobacteria bacterium]|nr:DUF4268 domain-containing protein [Acidobacteriota bacterium]